MAEQQERIQKLERVAFQAKLWIGVIGVLAAALGVNSYLVARAVGSLENGDWVKEQKTELTGHKEVLRSELQQEASSLLNVLPLGSIMAWHPNTAQPPLELPEGWARCDGQSIALPGSPLSDRNGVLTLPNLNTTPDGYRGGGRFLRGGNESGAMQDGTFISGITEIGNASEAYTGYHQRWRPEDDDSGADAIVRGTNDGRMLIQGTRQAAANVTRADGYRPRPVNMAVVWIMRVK